MNREIQFRAWHAAGKEMLPNVQKHIGNDTWAFGNMLNNPDEFKMMQYTGLKDENGKEIYEGDIIQSEHSEQLYRVIFRCETASFCLQGLKDGKFASFHQSNIWMPHDEPRNWDEIIGNIYENEHLLNDKN